jgi:uncharacterized protein YqeY
MLEEQINQDLKSAMKAGDTVKTDALRLIKSSIQLEKTNGTLHELTDEQIIKIIQKLSKQKEETRDMYRSAGKDDMANIESGQKRCMDYYLPEMLTEDQLRVIVDDIISHNGFSSIKDMKAIMSILATDYPGQYDGKVAGKLIKEML